MESWSDEDLYRLTGLYSKHRILWDREHPEYHNLHERYKSYCRILEGLCMPSASVSDVLSILRELRLAYVSELRRMQIDICSHYQQQQQHQEGHTDGIYRPVAKWFWVMHGFLYDHLDPDESEQQHQQSPNPNKNPSSNWISQTSPASCACDDIAMKKDKDDPGVMHVGVTQDEKKWDKVDDEENEGAGGNGEFPVTSASVEQHHKGEILFIRAPGPLTTIRMNTVYEFQDRGIVKPTKNSSNVENQYKVDNGSVGNMLNANVDDRTCCWMNKGACKVGKRLFDNQDEDQ